MHMSCSAGANRAMTARVWLTYICVLLSSYAVVATADEFLVGAGVHVGQNKVSADSSYTLLRSGGFNSFRDEVSWGRLEKQKGVFAFPDNLADLDRLVRVKSREGQLSPLLVLDYGNDFYDEHEPPRSPEAIAAFARYCQFVAQRYRDTVPIFEVWNEWNAGMGSQKRPRPKGSAEDYVRLLEKAVPAIRAAAPKAIIVGGATAHYDRKWTDDFVRAGGLKWIDGFSIHPYDYNHPINRLPEHAIAALEMLQSQLRPANSGREFPVYVTEIGWPTHEGQYGVSEQLAADHLVRFFALAASLSYVRGVWWYELVDGGPNNSDREDRFGIARRDLTPKPALSAIRSLAPILRNGKMKMSGNLDGGARFVVWDLPDGNQATAMWAVEGSATLPLTVDSAKAGAIVQIAGKSIAKVLDRSGSGAPTTVELDQSPIVLRYPKGSLTHGR